VVYFSFVRLWPNYIKGEFGAAFIFCAKPKNFEHEKFL